MRYFVFLLLLLVLEIYSFPGFRARMNALREKIKRQIGKPLTWYRRHERDAVKPRIDVPEVVSEEETVESRGVSEHDFDHEAAKKIKNWWNRVKSAEDPVPAEVKFDPEHDNISREIKTLIIKPKHFKELGLSFSWNDVDEDIRNKFPWELLPIFCEYYGQVNKEGKIHGNGKVTFFIEIQAMKPGLMLSKLDFNSASPEKTRVNLKEYSGYWNEGKLFKSKLVI